MAPSRDTVGAEEHDVVWIHEVHGEKPGFPLRSQLLAMAAKPVDAHRRDDAVVQIATPGMRDDIAYTEIVAETIGRAA